MKSYCPHLILVNKPLDNTTLRSPRLPEVRRARNPPCTSFTPSSTHHHTIHIRVARGGGARSEAAGAASLEALEREVEGAALERARLLWDLDQQPDAMLALQEARPCPVCLRLSHRLAFGLCGRRSA